MPRLVRLILRLIRDSRVPVFAKIVFFFGVAYTLWPADLIPDLLLPVIGYADDVAVLLLCARYLFYQTPPEVLEEHLYALQTGRNAD